MDPIHTVFPRRAFPATPDTSSYYAATGHERALARLIRGLEEGEGLLLLTGAPGTGKTLLCHCLLERLGRPAEATVFVTNGQVRDRVGLLQTLLFDLGLPYQGRGEQEMRLALIDRLIGDRQAGPTLLVIDEAHSLAPEPLEELRLLANLEAGPSRAAQVLLCGQPDLLETLRRPELASLRQRLAVRAELEPLDVQEAADYLVHHLRIAGVQAAEVIDDEALEALARGTGGVPRLLNQAANRALALAAEAEAGHVELEAALEALAALGLEVLEGQDEAEPTPEEPETVTPRTA
jgi:type II secretory pathway predicted ATPase ExeA